MKRLIFEAVIVLAMGVLLSVVVTLFRPQVMDFLFQKQPSVPDSESVEIISEILVNKELEEEGIEGEGEG